MRAFVVILAFLASGWTAGAQPAANFFRDKVEPILAKHCYGCHSAQAEKIKGGLLLDTREGVLRGGETGTALIPGDPDNSKIVIAVRHSDPDLRMPPKEKLADDQIAAIEQWVKTGAEDPRASVAPGYSQTRDLWSLKPIISTEPPTGSAINAVDRFILAGLDRRKLQPVARADKRTLIRRATFDLIGLPPTPAEVEAFLKDESEGAFARVVDRLLEAPQFGERWARHWLDVARYADSNGFDFNTVLTNAWRYRDYVIAAFNQDLPFAEFIREQIAGDLLPVKDNEDRHRKWIATGFLMLGPKNIGEPNREKLLMDIADEQIDVTSRAFLGLTVSCARCHDHKFDPIPTRDYYALAGIFRSTETISASAERVGPNGFLSERPLGTAEQAAEAEAYQTKLSELQRKRDRARRLARELPGGIDSTDLDGIVIDNLKAEVIGEWKLSNYSTNFVDKNYLHDGNEKHGKGKKSVRFRPEIPEDGFYEVRLAYTARLNRSTNVPVRVQTSTGTKTVFLNQTVEPKYDKAFETLGFFQFEKGTNNLVEVLTEGTKGFVVVDAVQFLPQEVQLAAKLKRRGQSPEEEPGMMMSDITAARREEFESAIGELLSTAPAPLPMALAVRDGEVRNSRIYFRGDVGRPGEEVPRGFLSVVAHVESGTPGTDESGRLALANWLASKQNPLPARVMVNRIWLHLFGRGLVNTPDNFGSMGEAPSHPELLDYLAAQFLAEGGSTKKMIRRLMLTDAYQRSSRADANAHAVDPENRFYWRMSRKRLEAEALRDAILAVNGSLELKLGGEATGAEGAGMGDGSRRDLIESRRRSLYLPVFRGSPNELFQVFDFPDPYTLAGKRYVTTAPTQALFLMNSPFMIEASEIWAEKLTARSKSESESVGIAYETAYARPCSEAERARAAIFIANFSQALIPTEPDAASRRKKAVAAFCQALFESAEFRFVN